MGVENNFKHGDIVKDLLNIKLSKLKDDGKILKSNVQHIEKLLKTLDINKENNKYVSLSCIYGAFLGDSIGSACEFSKHKKIFKKGRLFKPGEITDDSEMALSAAFAYIDSLNNDPSKIQDYLYFYFCLWRGSVPKDIGNTTASALRLWKGEDIKETKFKPEEVKINWSSLANGALMRISTFIVYFYYKKLDNLEKTILKCIDIANRKVYLNDDVLNLYFDIFVEVYKNVQITHPNYENGISCAVFSLMVLVGMITKDAKIIYSLFKEISESKKFIDIHKDKDIITYAAKTQEKYKQITSEVESNKPILVYSHMGYYLHAFKLSISYIFKYPDMAANKEKDLYYKIMCDICNKGGDTDTNCAIVGTLIGPLIGYKNFNGDLFKIFIKYIPPKRTQYTSAFIYEYVNYLEQNILNQEKNENKNEKSENDEEFHYAAFQMIQKFLNENLYGKTKKK